MEKDKYIGRMLDNRYEILEVIGTGGMAVVYKARCHRLNRLVAIKILKDDNLEDEDFRRRFHAESQAVAMLSHPNIVNVYDVSTSVMADYIVMELIEGITLKQYMAKKGMLNWKETLHFAMQIAKALEHAHSKGIVHRDIKPHNVMVLKNGSVKVMDFGIARLISHGNTLTKEALGSVHYISPEQARGGRIDDRSDIYSLGVVMYEMMAGRPPYDGESPVAVAIQHINGGASLPSLLNPNIPGGLEQIIMKAMARNLSDRYPSATRMLADMDEFRKDPTMLFDYTGLPLDAAIRVQKVLSEKENAEQNAEKGIEEQVVPAQPKPVTVPKRNFEQYRQRQERFQNFGWTRSRGTTMALIICSAVAVLAMIIFMAVACSNQNKGSDEKIVKVPKFVGVQLSEFSEYKDLIIMKEEVYDETVPAGEIISQKVEPGTEVLKASRVEVVVSLGPQPTVIMMPDLQNKTRDEALAALSQLGFVAEVEEKNDDNIPVGAVISTDPAKDSPLTKDTKIKLFVSKGQKITTLGGMPNVVGETKEKAEEILKNQKMNLQIVIEEVFDPAIATGIVVETNPNSGVGLKANDTVTLRVSKGVEMKQMPSMVGMSLTEAKDKLKELGFTKEPVIKYSPGVEAKDTVVSQLPEAEKEYELGVEITLEVSDGSLVPKTVTKNVVIDLKGYADENRCGVTIKREGQKDIDLSVPKGTPSVELIDEEGAGMVYYTIVINDTDTWTHIEDFSEVADPTEPTQEAAAPNG
ncbi:MAG: Stk1 family PASTA domain-containing Ser/Thr kinase [Oscillospiraceae bacterium]|nr:Stk1 family PASTA domain-containing Ser/Thr kinase [Oscillospiraceae bacterium]